MANRDYGILSLGHLWRHRDTGLLVLLLVGLLLLLFCPAASAYRSDHVVLVIVDGLRYSEGLGDPSHAYVPEMYELSKQGSIVEPMLNDWITDTMHGIPTIWCGAHSDLRTSPGSGCSGVGYTYSELPTIFEYHRKGLGRKRTDCIYALQDVNGPWRASLDPDYGPEYWPLYHSEGTSDLDVWHEAENLLTEDHPSFFLLYLERVDHFGHSGSWAYYTRAVEVADSIVGMVWDFIESDPVYAGKTTLFVTNDHGRHTDDWTSHGCDCEGCRTVMLLAVGPDIKGGFIAKTPRTICDITPTIGEIMGFDTPKATGSVMWEILQRP
jgi:hypothetical protein